jgi:hypothetical protein
MTVCCGMLEAESALGAPPAFVEPRGDADHRQDPIAAPPQAISRGRPRHRHDLAQNGALHHSSKRHSSFEPGPHSTAPSRDPSSLRPALRARPAPVHCRPGFRWTVRPLLQPAIWFEIRCSSAPIGRWAWLRRRADTNLGQCFIVETVRQRAVSNKTIF